MPGVPRLAQQLRQHGDVGGDGRASSRVISLVADRHPGSFSK